MKVLIFGLGLNGGGFEAALYFLKHNHEVRITDLKKKSAFGKAIKKLEDLGGEFILGEHRKEDFIWADLVVKNTVITPTNEFLNYAKQVTNDFSFLFDNFNLDNTKIIAITGTKGKTTTTSAVTHVLKHKGYNTLPCGNIGISAFKIAQYIEDNETNIDYLVCEFSSWQLRDTLLYMKKEFPYLEVALITNLMEDHLNNYLDMNTYKEDKLLMFSNNLHYAICPRILRNVIKEKTQLKRKFLISLETGISNGLCNKPELIPAYKILKTQNLKDKEIFDLFATYKGIPHRIEWLGIVENTAFINDSAATISEAVSFTFSHFNFLQVHLICGGTDKNLKPDGMLEALKKAVTITLLDGTFTKNKLIPLLERENLKYNGPYSNMAEAVDVSYKESVENYKGTSLAQAILLSPGAASFDLFLNEFDRGNKFKAEFKSLSEKHKGE